MFIKNKFLFVITVIIACFTQVFSYEVIAAQSKSVSGKKSAPEFASGSVLLVDLSNNKTLYSSRAEQIRPIASITKLMTAMVVLDAKQPLNEKISIKIDQTDELKGVYSRVKLNSVVSRRTMLLLALMSSENRAAASLAHHYPGGYQAFIKAMNRKARELGMYHTRYVEPTGLSKENVSTASDLLKLLIATKNYPLLQKLSTTPEQVVEFSHPKSKYKLTFRNTNYLVRKSDWNINLTKTGFTNPAGHCLVMRTTINHRPMALILLDSFGKYTHLADAGRVKAWLENRKIEAIPAASLKYKRNRIAKLNETNKNKPTVNWQTADAEPKKSSAVRQTNNVYSKTLKQRNTGSKKSEETTTTATIINSQSQHSSWSNLN